MAARINAMQALLLPSLASSLHVLQHGTRSNAGAKGACRRAADEHPFGFFPKDLRSDVESYTLVFEACLTDGSIL